MTTNRWEEQVEDSSTSLKCRNPKDGDKNTGIGHMISEEGCQDKGYGDGKIAHFTPEGASAGQSLSTGRMSHRKWWMVLVPWKGKVKMRME